MTISKPYISIIIPTYNGEKFLYKFLDSIQRLNDREEIEVIFIDNNSNDSTIEIIESFKLKIEIKIIKKRRNLGFAKACNIGVTHAKGEFIFISNQDMIFPPNFFQKLIKIYFKYKHEHEIIISPAIIFEGNGIHYFGAKIHFLGFAYTPVLHQKLPEKKVVKFTNRFSGGTLFIKKELFLKMRGFDGHFFMYYEDTDLSLRTLRKGLKILTTNDPYLIHQKHEWRLNNFSYYLLERNRFIVILKNIDNLKKLIPFFFIIEIVLLFHSILIKKFNLRVRIYYEIITKRNLLRELRNISREEFPLLPYQKLSKTLDSVLIGNLNKFNFLNKFVNLLNVLFKLI